MDLPLLHPIAAPPARTAATPKAAPAADPAALFAALVAAARGDASSEGDDAPTAERDAEEIDAATTGGDEAPDENSSRTVEEDGARAIGAMPPDGGTPGADTRDEAAFPGLGVPPAYAPDTPAEEAAASVIAGSDATPAARPAPEDTASAPSVAPAATGSTAPLHETARRLRSDPARADASVATIPDPSRPAGAVAPVAVTAPVEPAAATPVLGTVPAEGTATAVAAPDIRSDPPPAEAVAPKPAPSVPAAAQPHAPLQTLPLPTAQPAPAVVAPQAPPAAPVEAPPVAARADAPAAPTAPVASAASAAPAPAPAPAPDAAFAPLAAPQDVEIRTFAPVAPRGEGPPVPMRQLPDAILATIRQAQTTPPPVQEARTEITLHPAELGRVRLVVRAEGDGFVVQVAAERAETMDLARRHIDAFERAAQESGLRLRMDLGGDAPRRNPQRADARATTGARGDGGTTADPTPSPQPVRTTQGRLDIRL